MYSAHSALNSAWLTPVKFEGVTKVAKSNVKKLWPLTNPESSDISCVENWFYEFRKKSSIVSIL